MAPEPVNVNEFQELAKQAIPKMYYDFYAGGAKDEHTLRENVEAFRRITFRPRVLVNVSKINMSTTLLGYNISAPILIAPSSMHQLAHPEGKIATARAAAACNTIMVLSFTPSCTIEEVASSCNAVRFFQVYVIISIFGCKCHLSLHLSLFGLGANGEAGAIKVLEMLKDELELTMALSGCPSLKDITRSQVRTEHEKPHSML